MSEDPEEIKPIVRLTHWTSTLGLGKRGSTDASVTRWTFNGVDADGNERVYAEFTSDEELQAWRETDFLFQEAQRATFDRLLSDPGTRDTVLKINIVGALEKGDTVTAIALARHLSPKALDELLRKPDDDAEDGRTEE